MESFELALCGFLILGALFVGALSALMFLFLGWWDSRKKPPLQ